MTMVFACVGSYGTLNRDLVGSREASRRPSGVPKGAEWRDRLIIPGSIMFQVRLAEDRAMDRHFGDRAV